MAALSLAFGILGNLISICLFLSPIPTFWRIHKEKSTRDFSWLPYSVTLLNCLLWTWYGLPWVQINIPVITINISGAILQLTYVLIYLRYTTAKKKMKIVASLIIVPLFVAVILLVTVFAMTQKSQRKLFVGILCVIFTTGMNVAPLSVMRMVIRTRSVEFMPFYLSLFVFINGCAWLAYGLLTSDVFVLIPNALGAFLGAMQLILYAIYSHATPKVDEAERQTGEKDLEMQKSGSVNGV
ncbi:hypothetical protein SELMODRAFT_408391 [Selaginella moellendorffii]|uniref:Bidirectional sugar transporter SWEET n=1 Tax=Selaginella moellendorffii TaxID=88036 RepID=D8R855_SELML|nr:bidirectional sugar transporter SWEET1a [Selaginella moellendorffii]EFJ31997.1 hypothetical protein SELMODRAFT_408391 [Selaginella moellendorffii]|eukprot:XP_002967398.1 bidirectional sugar transporter SWEET1a [Selaginella moellendorffii]